MQQGPAEESLRRVIEESVGRPARQTVRRVRGLVRELPLSRHRLKRDAALSVACEVPSRETPSPSEILSDESEDGRLDGGAILEPAGNGGAVEQGEQAGSEDDTVKLSPAPIHQGATVAEPHHLQAE
jgi:hypothetical protein